MNEINLPVPSNVEMKKWISHWHSLPDYVAQEKALNRIFVSDNKLRLNVEMEAVLIKCATLNDFYSTKLYKVYLVADWIVKIRDIDVRLAEGDLSLVNDITRIGGNKYKLEGNGKMFTMPRIYSFATKFCSHHNERDFPIYDSYVHQVLHYYNTQECTHFTDVPTYRYPRKGDGKYPPLEKTYMNFVQAMSDFRSRFGLVSSNGFKDIDLYLWQLGKESFPKSYGKRQS